jgi:membrane protein DedA with SNARE-associated domain
VPAPSAGRGNDPGIAVSHLLELIRLADFDSSWLAKFLSLMVLPFAYEDLAIILGGYIVVNQLMPVGLVALGVYAGIVASDFALYGIGAGARRLPWLRRLAVDDRVKSSADVLRRNLFELVAFCRVVPGVDFIAFIACGWTRVPLARFTLASLIISALYLPLMLYLVVVFGDALDDHFGLWAWPFLLGAVAITGFLRYRIFAFRQAASAISAAPERTRFHGRWRSQDPSDRSQSSARLQLTNLNGLLRSARWLR